MTRNMAQVPYRQIRASYNNETITVYQAYSEEIAIAAVRAQKLAASSSFRPQRFTWIKPSWCWMMYRSGYACKDAGQSRVLALHMKHESFEKILKDAIVTGHGGSLTPEEKARDVRVQWDPERTPRLEVLPYRSIQIGIGGVTAATWANEYIERIEDLTEKALLLKKVLADRPDVGDAELMKMGLVPEERVYEIPEELRGILGMK